MKCEDEYIISSIAVAKMLASDHTVPELAVYASFFTSVAANLSVIIQNRNLCTVIAQQKAATASAPASNSVMQENPVDVETEVSAE